MSELTTVKAKWPTGETDEEGKAVYITAEASFDFGGSTEQAVTDFGEEAVYSNYHAGAKIQFQNAIRQHGLAGVVPEEIAAKLAEWKPGQKVRTSVDPQAVMRQRYAAATTDEARESILRSIMGEDEDEEA